MPEPDWKQALSRDLVIHGFLAETDEERLAVVMPHIDAAYQRGLMAGRSQANYPTRRKKKESDPCTAAAEGRTPASPTAGDEA